MSARASASNDSDRRLHQLFRLGRACLGVGGCTAAVIIFGVIIAWSSEWSWPPTLLPLLMVLVVVLSGLWGVAEGCWRLNEAQRVRDEEAAARWSPERLARLRRALDGDGRVPVPATARSGVEGDGALSDEALRGYFLGLHDRDTGVDGEAR